MGDSEIKEVEQNEPKKAEKAAEGKTTVDKTVKKKTSRMKGLISEFKRIIWPTKDTIIKETTAVVIVTVILGAVIALIDWLIKTGLDKVLQIG